MGQLTVKESNLMFALTAGFLKLQYKRFKAMKKSEISCSIQKSTFFMILSQKFFESVGT